MHIIEIFLLISESKKKINSLFKLAKTVHFVLNFDRQLVNVLNFCLQKSSVKLFYSKRVSYDCQLKCQIITVFIICDSKYGKYTIIKISLHHVLFLKTINTLLMLKDVWLVVCPSGASASKILQMPAQALMETDR